MYGKLFASLYQGTLRGRSDEILVFTNLLAHADSHGFVDKHWRAIGEETGLPVDRVEKAIELLEAPDPDSRSADFEGRRLIRMDEHRAWGWRIVNYEKYRAIRSEEDRREQNRLAQERWRNRQKVSKVSRGKPQSAQAEAEAEAISSKTIVAPLALPEWLDKECWQAYVKIRPTKARSQASLKGALQKLEAFRAVGFDANEIVATSLANGWQGLFEPKKGNGKDHAAHWWSSEATIIAKGEEIGISARAGESIQQYKGRIEVALAK